MADRVVSYQFRGDFKSLTAGLSAAGRSVNDLGGKLTALDAQGAKMRAGLTTIGGAAGKAGLLAAAGFAAGVVGAANFEQAMSSVKAATGETAENMDKLREAAIQAGADTAFSASEAAAGIENLAKAGVSTADILGGGLAGSLDLAAAGELDVAQAAEIAATTMTQFGLAGSDVAGIADVLAAAAGKAQGEVTDMAGALQYVGPVAAQMGLSLEETGGSIAYLATQGIVGQQAGTSLRGMLTALTSPSKAAKDQMEALGISMYDASGRFIGLDGLAGQLKGSMENLTEAERNEALGRIFGNEQITAARVLYAGGSEAIQEWTAKVDDSGFAAEQAATKLDNLKGDVEAFMGSLETALIGTGEGAQGPLRSLVQDATSAVNVFNDMPPAVQNTTSALLGITALTGGGLWFGSKVVNGVADTKQALSDLGVQANVTSRALMMRGAAAGLGAVTLGLGSLNDKAGATGRALSALSDTVGYAAMGFAVGGPWGAAIGGAVGMLKNLGNAQGAAAVEAESLTDAIDSQTLALNKQGYAQIGEQLAGYADVADAAGLSLGTFINAAVAGGDELERVDGILRDFADATSLAITSEQIDPELVGTYTELATGAEDFRKALTDQNGEVAKAIDLAKGRQAGLDAASAATEGATSATEGYTTAAGDSARVSKEEADAIREAADAMREKREAALAGFDAETRWGQAVTEAREAAAKGARGIDQMSAAGRENRAALSELASAWNNLPPKVQAVEGRFKAARTQFIDTATAMGVPIDRARTLANSLLEIPTKRHTDITANTGQAQGAITSLKTALDNLPRTITTYVNVVRRGLAGMGFAAGGLVTGPGGPRDDLIPAMLSDREFVMPAAAVEHYGVGIMEALRARAVSRNDLALAAGETVIEMRRPFVLPRQLEGASA